MEVGEVETKIAELEAALNSENVVAFPKRGA
jgi:hypothetical protein